jgi:protein-disulfide isomerase
MLARAVPVLFVSAFAAALTACGTPAPTGDGSASASTGGAPAAGDHSYKVVTADEGLPDPVARIGDKAITLAELNDKSAAQVAKAQQDLYEARRGQLDQMIAENLLDAEAAKRGITREALVKAEVEDKVSEPSEAEVNAFYEKNKARIRQPLDAVKDQVAGRLKQQKQSEVMSNFIDSLKAATKVEVYLAPPRFAVDTTGEPRQGNPTAPVQIVEFSDFQCPYCSMADTTVKEVQQKYGDKVAIVYRHFPLPMHQFAHRAAEAADCAGDQGKFWEYHDQLFANQRSLDDDSLITYATNVGMDSAAFRTCLTGNTHTADVDKDAADGEKVGMSGTPGFYINGRMLSGAQPIEAFSEVIDEELASAK